MFFAVNCQNLHLLTICTDNIRITRNTANYAVFSSERSFFTIFFNFSLQYNYVSDKICWYEFER